MLNFLPLLILITVSLFTPFTHALNPNQHPREWVIDTDVGLDDVLAILYLLNQPQIKIKAITIEADGNAHCKPAFENIQGLLQLSHQTTIPVACGRSLPLRGHHQFPKNVMASCDSLANTPLKKPLTPLPKLSAKNLLIQTLVSATEPLDLLALGPLTTLAEVFEDRPELKTKIHMIYMMGGAITVPGNIKAVEPKSNNQVAEWNIYIDPYAAEQLFHSGLPITLVPLDSTQQVLMDYHFYEALKAKHDSPIANFAYDLLNHNKKMLRDKSWYFWDPLAAVIALDESLANIEILPISVHLQPETLAGATVIDRKKGAMLRVCMRVKADKFKKQFLQGLN